MRKRILAVVFACLFAVPAFGQSYRDMESYKRLPRQYQQALDDNFPVECRARGAELLDFWWPQVPHGGFGVINNETVGERNLDKFAWDTMSDTAEGAALELLSKIGSGAIRADRRTRVQARRLFASSTDTMATRVVWGDHVRLITTDSDKVFLTCFVETCPIEGGCLSVSYGAMRKNLPQVIAPSIRQFDQFLEVIQRSRLPRKRIAALKRKFNSDVARITDRLNDLPDTMHLISLQLPKIRQARPEY